MFASRCDWLGLIFIMQEIVVEPFSQSTPSGKKVIMFMMILQALMACNYQIIPLLFYRPQFYCSSEMGPILCEEVEACQEKPLQYKSDYTFSSISLEFELYCDSKKDEATILTFMMLGHILGGFISTWLSDLGNNKRSLLVVLVVSSLISGISCAVAGFTHSIFILGLALTIWGVSSEVIQNFINMSPTLFFPTEAAKKVFVLIITSWSLYAIIIPSVMYIHLSWRALLVINLAVPHLLWAGFVWHYSDEMMHETTKPEYSLQQLLILQSKGSNQSDQSVSIRDLRASSHLRNIVTYFLIFSASYVSMFSAIFTLGTVQGNIYFNLTTICALEIIVFLAGGYVAKRFSIPETLKLIYFVLFVSFGLYTFLPSFWQSYVVIQGKVITDVTWILLSSFGIMIVPLRFIPLVTSLRGITNLTLVMVMPYVKYFMERIRLNLFVFSAIYELVSYVSLQLIKTQDLSVL